MALINTLNSVARVGDHVCTKHPIRGLNYQIVPGGCVCQIDAVVLINRRYQYLLNLNGLTVWAEASDFKVMQP